MLISSIFSFRKWRTLGKRFIDFWIDFLRNATIFFFSLIWHRNIKYWFYFFLLSSNSNCDNFKNLNHCSKIQRANIKRINSKNYTFPLSIFKLCRESKWHNKITRIINFIKTRSIIIVFFRTRNCQSSALIHKRKLRLHKLNRSRKSSRSCYLIINLNRFDKLFTKFISNWFTIQRCFSF